MICFKMPFYVYGSKIGVIKITKDNVRTSKSGRGHFKNIQKKYSVSLVEYYKRKEKIKNVDPTIEKLFNVNNVYFYHEKYISNMDSLKKYLSNNLDFFDDVFEFWEEKYSLQLSVKQKKYVKCDFKNYQRIVKNLNKKIVSSRQEYRNITDKEESLYRKKYIDQINDYNYVSFVNDFCDSLNKMLNIKNLIKVLSNYIESDCQDMINVKELKFVFDVLLKKIKLNENCLIKIDDDVICFVQILYNETEFHDTVSYWDYVKNTADML